VSVKASTGNPAYTVQVLPLLTFWVTASPNGGSLPATISVRVNPTSLAVGQYAATVNLTVTGLAAPVVVSVTLNVTAAPSTLTLSPTTLNLTGPPDPPAQTVLLSTNGAPISFTAAAGAAWMTVSPKVGVVLPGQTLALTVTVSSAGLAAQTAPYSAKITVTASGSVTAKAQNITVNFTVISSTPTITNLWPPVLPVGAGAQTMTIFGTGFYSATVVKVQGVATPLVSTVVSPTAMLAVVPSSMLTASGFLTIIVENPPPGGDSAPDQIAVTNAPTIAGVFNAASYSSATVSPGELVTIFGSNIGPPIPASMTITNGFVDTALSGVSVDIGGTPAPILYVSPNQVTVQVPYEVSTGSQNVTLTNGSNPQATGTVTVDVAAPGIFTADGSGSGQAAALNLNAAGALALNNGTNLAPIGQTVILYLTGEGNYLPSLSGGGSNTGYVIPTSINPLPASMSPSVTIGGVDASAGVTYAGVVPGSITGLLQINVTVPTGSATGVAVPVTVTISGITTQANVTLGIHK
jgi:uncharacterized protein (TIGR03437 family)